MLNVQDLKYIADKCEVQYFQVENVIQMFNDGMTIPFISRYRKEKTGNLDEYKVNIIKDNFFYVSELQERKATIIKTITQQEKLTSELNQQIQDTYSKTELEDIYLPYKPKRRTKATIAREKGLEPLAQAIVDAMISVPLETLARPYVNEEKGVPSIEAALEEAGYIIIESYSEHAPLRKVLREELAERGILSVSVTKDFAGKRSKFEQYYEFQEAVKTIPSHRFLAIKRGDAEKVLKSRIELDKDKLQRKLRPLVFDDEHPRSEYLIALFNLALNGRLLPSLELEVQKELKTRADEDAIKVFATNLENLLLAPPAGNLRVLAVDPGLRTGCKLVVLDETGKLLDMATIFPNKPAQDVAGATKTVRELLAKHSYVAVAIGNGTASRETRTFFKAIMPEHVIVSVVNEAGASVYSASEVGRLEFPDHDATVRGSISIGRRFQDPLSELVKIDPKAIGVGQYQHDVHQGLLRDKLDSVVTSVVNRVGVELNNASQQILKYVSGINDTVAKNIVNYRNEHGMFQRREDLLSVKMFGQKAFQQSAGFLRLRAGDNPLDSTGIHPESYAIVENMNRELKCSFNELIGNKTLISRIKPEQFVTENFGIPTIQDIIKELENPGRDPRKDFEVFEFEESIQTIEDLKEGMTVKGVVTNVTRFGAFVDIGVHQDGLVHISNLSHQFVTNPEEVIAVGEKVTCQILNIDLELKRIQLSIKALLPPPKRFKHSKKKPKKDVSTADMLKNLKKKWETK
ncbi:Tex family protein [candidate division CSSED10-310 bacterium]|uniref:Tex family protein n=1 Tax=candidate division CSSED10-310 bacterium TaxID=2855610 RepID=A0ABV6YRN5_UNCC1